MALGKVVKNSLVQDIVAQIEEAILDGTYKPGDRLPPLPELQKIIGASQGTLREAISSLKQKGLVEVRRGVKGGAFIKDSNTDSISESLGVLIRQRKISFTDLAQFRIVIETGLIQLVIDNITATELQRLKAHLIKMKTISKKGLQGWSAFIDEEVLLRKDLILIANNEMYSAVLIPIHENIFSFARTLPILKELKPETAYRDWHDIIMAIEKKDYKTAITITKNHIARYAKIYLAHKSDET